MKEKTPRKLKYGIYTLGDLTRNPHTLYMQTARERLEEVITLGKEAERLELDVFGVGEHHRLDYVTPATAIILSALARETKKIILASTTTVLSTVDPVRLFSEYATIDLLSHGRAEIIAGRGAFSESFSLYGYDHKEYDALFIEHLHLLAELNENEIVTWNGERRSNLKNAEISPRPYNKSLKITVGGGGSLATARLAGEYCYGHAIALLSGQAEKIVDAVKVYEDRLGDQLEKRELTITSHGYVAETTDEAIEIFYPFYHQYKKGLAERSEKPFQLSKEEFTERVEKESALLIGSPEDVANKILEQRKLLNHDRILIQMDIGGISLAEVQASMELFAHRVIPRIENALNK